MGRKSSIHKLPADAREHIDKLMRDNSMTLAEMLADICEHFPDAAAELSTSTLWRYKKSGGFEEFMSQMQRQQQAARMAVSALGENPDDKAGTLLVQSVMTLVQSAAFAAQGDTPDTEEVLQLSIAMKNALQGSKLSREERSAVIREAREQQLREQQANLDKVASAQGLSEDQVQFWRESVLGIK
ncbi:uncharacterized protein DUF3486 [Serratia fonticola]|uniref:Uncharacterized protein DUF3486 n=1 Tax=Serratia fonticola TaxID=47917 RepID=A0A542BJE8_SERFO|nr:phage protein Gp27 family protein [Serratia fonticola]TQI78712.1 uncharacterized protein DUF3486 [Serratia fonticola]TQI99266.1 uncharacterized protein DUF3486 [Serratia fonticola]TVZ68791.1 uncharacterized protein DUF3486 [Serratia fonticola]